MSRLVNLIENIQKVKTDLHGFIGFVLLILVGWLVIDIASDLVKVFTPRRPHFMVTVKALSRDEYMTVEEKKLVDRLYFERVKEKYNLR